MSPFNPSQDYINYTKNFDEFRSRLTAEQTIAFFNRLEQDANDSMEDMLNLDLLEEWQKLMHVRNSLEAKDFNGGEPYGIEDALDGLQQLIENGMPEDPVGNAIVQQTINNLGGWEAAQEIVKQSQQPDFDPSQLDPEIYDALINAANTTYTTYHTEVIITISPVEEVNEFFNGSSPEIIGMNGENLIPPHMLPDTPNPTEHSITRPQLDTLSP